jgi:hypothetical protein
MIVAVAVAAGLTISACGSSQKPSARAALPQFISFSHCMRAHGVPHFPDPTGRGGINLDGTGINPASPAFRQAQNTCQKLLPGGGPGNQKPSAQDKAQMLAVSQCMRAHGVTGFPDPTVKPPGLPSLGSYSIAIDRGGVFIGVPKSIDVTSPAFRQAAQTCGFGGGPGLRTKVPAAP